MPKRLVDILTEQGKLSEENLHKAELHSRQNDIPLVDSILALGLVKEEDIAMATSAQLSVP